MPPSNDSFATALNISSVPFSITQDASGLTGPGYKLYYKYTAMADGLVGIWAQAPSASNYATLTLIYLETSPGVWTEDSLLIEPYQVPAQVPVFAGTTYFFEVTQDNGIAPDADLTFLLDADPDEAIPTGSLLVSDFTPGFPGAFISATTGAILGYRIEIPSSDFGDMLPNGISAWIDNGSTPPHVIILDTDLTQIADVTGLTNGLLFQSIRANGVDRFYVGRNNNGGTSVISTVDATGAVGGTTWTLGANSQGLVAMAPSRDDTILYYGGLNGGSAAIHRHDLITDLPLSDLVAAPGGGYSPDKDLLVMSDGSILVVWKNFPNDEVIQYNAAGATLQTFVFASESLDRIALNAIDSSTTFWVWTFPDNETCRFREIRISDGATVSGPFDVPQFNNGQSFVTFSDTMDRFGISNSCPLILSRSAFEGGGGNGGPGPVEGGIIGPLAWVHWPRLVPGNPPGSP